jgi:hypothetical protein
VISSFINLNTSPNVVSSIHVIKKFETNRMWGNKKCIQYFGLTLPPRKEPFLRSKVHVKDNIKIFFKNISVLSSEFDSFGVV